MSTSGSTPVGKAMQAVIEASDVGPPASGPPDLTRLSVLHVLAPGEVGGLESVVRLMAAGQRRNGHTVWVGLILARSDAAQAFQALLRAENVDVIPIVSAARAYARQYHALVEVCRRLSPSVVHTHGYHADVLAGLAARRLGFVTVTTVHGFTGGGGKKRLYDWLQRRAFRRFSAVMPVSRPMADDLGRGGVHPARLHVVPNAFTLDAQPLARADARRRLALGPDAHVGWIGRLSPEKGPDVMIRALVALPPTVRLSVLGDGPRRHELNRLADELGVSERIVWYGVVPDAARLAAAFDVVVLSSRAEGTPVVLLEAMAAGVPIVATRVGGVPDVVSSAEACLVEPNDPAALASAIAATLADPTAAATRAAAARQRLAESFALGPWLARIDDVYARAMREASTSSRR
jgi:glycosyltransferase involved in cell wall biosynthesis